MRERLIRLGPTFIKIGQGAQHARRPAAIPYIDELSKLQDCVPPFPNEVAFSIIEKELGERPETIFAEISPQPIAAASLGQVTAPGSKTGQEVAIKVQRLNLTLLIPVRLWQSFAASSPALADYQFAQGPTIGSVCSMSSSV